MRGYFIVLVLLCYGVSHAASAELKAGFATVDITPPVPYRMCGYFHERPSTGVHDPLWAKAMVLHQGGESAALVFCDLAFVSRPLTDEVRRRASQDTGIPAKNILIAATHSHTGPLFEGVLRDLLHQRAVREKGHDPLEARDYPKQLVSGMVEAIQTAFLRAQPVIMEAGKTQVTDLSFNRRFHMKDGAVVFNPGKANPNIVRPAGPIDPELGVLLFVSRDQLKPKAVWSNFALHLDTVGGTQYSADYPFYIETVIQKVISPEVVSIFANSTCGDINHIDVSHTRAQSGFAEAERIGSALGEKIIQTLPKVRPVTPALAVRSRMVEFPKQEYSTEDLEKARERIDRIGSPELAFLTAVESCRILALHAKGPGPLKMEVQVFRLGKDTAIVGLPGEVFVELGLEIKKSSPFPNTFVVELANDSVAYVPTQKAFQEGSYEVVNSMIQPGGGEALVKAAHQLLKELHK